MVRPLEHTTPPFRGYSVRPEARKSLAGHGNCEGPLSFVADASPFHQMLMMFVRSPWQIG
jgi:hypothetical protein